MKFAICSEIFQGWAWEDTTRFVAQTGYDAIEIAPFTVAPYVSQVAAEDRQRLRAVAAGEGLVISGIHWVLAKTEGMHLNAPDGAVRARTAAYLVELVDFCADLGGQRMVVGSPKQRDVLPGVSPIQARAWALESFRGAVRRAEERGVVICLEPLAPTETNFINTAAEAIGFVLEAGSPAFKVMLDVKAMCSEGVPIPQLIRQAWPHFAYFHANDPNLKGPGFGEMDFGPIAAALEEVGYDGFVSVEVFDFTGGPEEIARRSLACLKKAFG